MSVGLPPSVVARLRSVGISDAACALCRALQSTCTTHACRSTSALHHCLAAALRPEPASCTGSQQPPRAQQSQATHSHPRPARQAPAAASSSGQDGLPATPAAAPTKLPSAYRLQPHHYPHPTRTHRCQRRCQPTTRPARAAAPVLHPSSTIIAMITTHHHQHICWRTPGYTSQQQ